MKGERGLHAFVSGTCVWAGFKYAFIILTPARVWQAFTQSSIATSSGLCGNFVMDLHPGTPWTDTDPGLESIDPWAKVVLPEIRLFPLASLSLGTEDHLQPPLTGGTNKEGRSMRSRGGDHCACLEPATSRLRVWRGGKPRTFLCSKCLNKIVYLDGFKFGGK